MSTVVEVGLGVNRQPGRYAQLRLVLGILFVVSTGIALASLTGAAGRGAWGVFTASFLYILGVSQLGVVWSAIMRICNTRWGRPFYRLGEVVTLAFLPFGILGVVFIWGFGRDELLYWVHASPEEHLSPWLNESFLLWRNLLAQIVFYAVAVWYAVMGLLPDVRDSDAQEGPGWRRALYRRLLARRDAGDMEDLKNKVYRYAPWVIGAYLLPNTFISWDLGMMLWPHYHSTIFTMYFMQGSLFAGTAMMLLTFVLLSRAVATETYVRTEEHVKNLGIMLTGFALLWLYLFWAQFFVTWFGNLPNEYGPLWAQMYGHYAPFFWTQMIFVIGIPIGTLIFAAVKRTLWSMLLLTAVMNAGIWINRYLTVLPALEPDHVLFANPVEIALVLSPITAFLFALVFLFNAFPMVSMWELRSMPPDPHAH